MKYDQFRALDWQPIKLTENIGPRELILYDVDLNGESISVIRTGEEITLYLISRRSNGPYYEERQICSFKIIDILESFSDGSEGVYRLSRISWNGKPAKLDFRFWVRPDTALIKTEDILLPGCGNTLSDEIAKRIFTGR